MEVTLAEAWRGLHVVGDSALVLGMMANRRPPKTRTLQHWYRQTRKLADLSAVETWKHHYCTHNKMADWLANLAMDSERSTMLDFNWTNENHVIHAGLKEYIEKMSGDGRKTGNFERTKGDD
ncbi:unnamed protein product [Phytophthora fragariaefolia]|uniref:Unnamed protein product n=1 Tax=Phytophthora fragariaefolia TaxID=1490495 RepID=A0A9W6WZ06_9STRA|nr:unnamed protein product [Phytophthora fragariaefolia]